MRGTAHLNGNEHFARTLALAALPTSGRAECAPQVTARVFDGRNHADCKGADAPDAQNLEKEEKTKATSKPETNTNSVRGVSANREQNQKTNTDPVVPIAQPYRRTCKKCGAALEPMVNHTCQLIKTKDFAAAKA